MMKYLNTIGIIGIVIALSYIAVELHDNHAATRYLAQATFEQARAVNQKCNGYEMDFE